ncbi:MAG: Fe2+/Zn2+ uptake regulation protein [Actinomycetia bacterium]|nr:Fe2+/Zn2+ uptake regulation protein [Actinomycetes bacterium]
MVHGSPDLSGAVTERLENAGQRLTGNRSAIVDVLGSAGRPMTIPEILEVRPDLAQSSVYRNLVVLEQAGLVHRIVTNDEFARYELAEDLTGHHHHLICANCGSVEDIPPIPALETAMDSAITQVARRTGFRTETHRIDLIGLCVNCV